MRVALVIQKFAGLRGGAERIVSELAVELERRGHEVVVASFEPHSGSSSYPLGGVRTVNLAPLSVRWAARCLSGRRSPAAVTNVAEAALSRRGNGRVLAWAKWQVTHGEFGRRLRRWIRRSDPDVVIGFLPPAISAVALGGVGHRARLIASTHNLPSEDFGDSGRWDQNPLARRRNLLALGEVDVVTVLQPEFVDELPAFARPLAVVMPNPVMRLAPPSGVLRERLIVGVGRLTDVKRYDVLVMAFAELADRYPGWALAIYGDGPERGRLEALAVELGIDERVRIVGAVAEIAAVYDAARVLAHPARFEGFGLSVAEAILHGVVVVASAECVGVNRLVEDGATGVLVAEGDDPVRAFSAGLERMMTDPPDDNLRREAADRLAERLSPKLVYDAWERLLSP